LSSAENSGYQIEWVIFQTPIIKVGVLRCPTVHPSFKQPAPTENYAVVFPRVPVSIKRDDGAKFVADPTTVVLWNRNQDYDRQAIVPEGAVADWFAVHPDIILDAVQTRDASVQERPEHPFRIARVHASPEMYLSQRRILRDVIERHIENPLYIEERVLTLLSHVIAVGYDQWGIKAEHGPDDREPIQEEIVWRAETFIGNHFREPLLISDIAKQAGASPFHLCRLFKERRNSTLHARCIELRLRTALEYVLDTKMDLTEISLNLGYSSHSHFTWAFRKKFGTTPSSMRGRR